MSDNKDIQFDYTTGDVKYRQDEHDKFYSVNQYHSYFEKELGEKKVYFQKRRISF